MQLIFISSHWTSKTPNWQTTNLEWRQVGSSAKIYKFGLSVCLIYIVLALLHLGRCFVFIGEYDRADPLLQRALRLMKKVRPEEHHDASASRPLSFSSNSGKVRLNFFLLLTSALQTLAQHYLSRGEVAKAFQMAEETLNIARSTRPEDHPDIAICKNEKCKCTNKFVLIAACIYPLGKTTLADCHRHAGDIEQALALYENCVQLLSTNKASVAAAHLVAGRYLMKLHTPSEK